MAACAADQDLAEVDAGPVKEDAGLGHQPGLQRQAAETGRERVRESCTMATNMLGIGGGMSETLARAAPRVFLRYQEGGKKEEGITAPIS